MGKRAHKRQRTETTTTTPLGVDNGQSQAEVAEKDDEERHLESIIFGVPFVSSKKSKKSKLDSLNVKQNVEKVENDGVDPEMQVLQDSDVRFITTQ